MITIELEDHEALVLFEFVAREIDDHKERRLAEIIEHPAEFWALNAVHCSLERILADPFRADYAALLAAAREKVIQQNDPDGDYGPIGGRVET